MIESVRFPLLLGWVLLLAACGGEAPAPAATTAELDATWRGEGASIVVRVDDLHCANCEKSVRREFSAVEGVVSVEPDHETDLVRVQLADAARRYDLIPKLDAALHKIGKKAVPGGEAPAE